MCNSDEQKASKGEQDNVRMWVRRSPYHQTDWRANHTVVFVQVVYE